MLRFLLLTVFLSVVAFAGAARAESFSADQKKEIGDVIHQYLLDNPEVLFEAAAKHQANQEKTADEKAKTVLKDKAGDLFDNAALPFLGAADGDVVLVEFFDYNCGYCKQAFPTLLKLTDEDKKLKIVMIDTPILSPASRTAALWALAAHKQGKYAAFHQALMESSAPKEEGVLSELATKVGLDIAQVKKDAASPEIAGRLEANMKIFGELGLSGTPAFAARDRVIRGFVGADVIKQIAVDERAGKK